MAIISFWSNTKKQTGQTMSMVAIATSMAIEHNYKILIVSTKYNDNTLDLCFGSADKNKNLVNKLLGNNNMTMLDNGIEGLYKVANSGRLTPELVQNYTHIVYKNRLEVLYGYKAVKGRATEEEFKRISEKYKEIIQNANKFYDMVFVDVESGLENEKSKEILDISDLIVYNVEQRLDMINEFNEFSKKNDKKNYILNIGRYDSFSKYSIKNMSRYTKIRRDICAIPYSTLYFEAAGEESVADLFLKIRMLDSADRNANFMNLIKDATEKIIYKLQELQMKM